MAAIANGQFYHPIFSNQQGQTLEQSLVTAYKPATVLNYSMARDTLFSKVYLERDSVVCVYTQHKVYLPPNTDPTVAVYMNGSQNGINTEHSYPQSKGASEANGNPHSDMHHLYPTRLAVNEARGSLPFKEIPDAQTTKWYYKDQTVITLPTAATIDLFSEWNSTGFEVRESQKGNLARSIFYFFTMYRAEALNADPLFFEAQRSTLCDWHHEDPVDSLEYTRTFIIGKYQSGKPNPFVLDCSLAKRTYCGTSTATCPNLPTVSVNDSDTPLEAPIWSIGPKPSNGEFQVNWNLPKALQITLVLTDMNGKEYEVLHSDMVQPLDYQRLNTQLRGNLILSAYSEGTLIASEKLIVID